MGRKQNIAYNPAAGTFLATVFGFLSRPCCSLPFFLSLAGLSSSSLVLMLQPYRYIFLATGLVAFAVSGYFTFRMRGATFNKVFFFVSFLATCVFTVQTNL
jgi:hypothetical protein